MWLCTRWILCAVRTRIIAKRITALFVNSFMNPHISIFTNSFQIHTDTAKISAQRFNGFFLSWWMPRALFQSCSLSLFLSLSTLLTGLKCLPISNIYIAFQKNFVLIPLKSQFRLLWGKFIMLYSSILRTSKRINLKTINNNYDRRAESSCSERMKMCVARDYRKWDKWVNKSEIRFNVSAASKYKLW